MSEWDDVIDSQQFPNTRRLWIYTGNRHDSPRVRVTGNINLLTLLSIFPIIAPVFYKEAWPVSGLTALVCVVVPVGWLPVRLNFRPLDKKSAVRKSGLK